MGTDLAEKIERLEARLPIWEKRLYACWGATLVMLANAAIRMLERSLLTAAFFASLENVAPSAFHEDGTISLTDPVSVKIQEALFIPYWHILTYVLLTFIFGSGLYLALHPVWRRVQRSKRFGLIWSCFLASWLLLVSAGWLDPVNLSEGYNLVLLVFLFFLGAAYFWLRRKKHRVEEIFP